MLAKCKNKFDCLVKELLFIRRLVPDLNVQTDSIRAKGLCLMPYDVETSRLFKFIFTIKLSFQLFSTFNRSSGNLRIIIFLLIMAS